MAWAGDDVRRDMASYSDRRFVCQWAIELNGQDSFVPKHRCAQSPMVKRVFTEAATDTDGERRQALAGFQRFTSVIKAV
jgi:hypothetical protein